ncbi:hypothetical protein [Pseudoalteromonas ruthenica]|nr:hypothetical protein [Pseudoalteromonas ruthenica]
MDKELIAKLVTATSTTLRSHACLAALPSSTSSTQLTVRPASVSVYTLFL